MTADALPAAARAFLERRDAEEEAVADAAVAAGVTYTMQLRKRHYDPKQVGGCLVSVFVCCVCCVRVRAWALKLSLQHPSEGRHADI